MEGVTAAVGAGGAVSWMGPSAREVTNAHDFPRRRPRTTELPAGRYTPPELGQSPEVLTSLDSLATATGQDVNDLRLVLAELVQSGDVEILRGQGPADVERLEAHHRFRLVMDRDHFHETRTELSLAGDEA